LQKLLAIHLDERDARLGFAFAEGEGKADETSSRAVQRPRVFYRRKLEAHPLVVARP
jgi:hypothetical protein